jgi:hypothetical protein
MKVILSVPDEGYSERTWWRLFWVYLMKVILSVPDEGYSECTWWRKKKGQKANILSLSLSWYGRHITDPKRIHKQSETNLILQSQSNKNEDIKFIAHDAFLE